MRTWILTALAIAALGGPAMADETKALQMTSRRVTPAEIAEAFPKAAYAQKISGWATLDCTADQAGREVDCRIVSEDPVGMGFGEAALRLVAKERVSTRDILGKSIIGRRFDTGFTFLAPGDSQPSWEHKPSFDSMAAAMPVRAMQEGRDGRATLTCQVTIEGFLDRCKVLSEEPADFGFGPAALLLAPQFKMSPMTRGGKPLAGEIKIPIVWKGMTHHMNLASARDLMNDPPWAAAPSLDQVRAAWPTEAKDVTVGQAVMRCGVSPDGALKRCEAISEAPQGKGFGRAAKGLAHAFRVVVRPGDAAAVRNLSVDVPIRFRAAGSPDTRRLSSPRWITTLTADGMASIYPTAAFKAGVGAGLGVVGCTVDVTGHLTGCAVKREDPAALDFGAAAIEAAKLMAMNPWTKEGDPVDGLSITLPIRFTLADDQPGATTPSAKP